MGEGKSRLEHILENKRDEDSKSGFKLRTSVNIISPLNDLQEEYDFDYEDIGKIFSTSVLESYYEWLSKYPPSLAKPDHTLHADDRKASRGIKKRFQEEVRNNLVLYVLDLSFKQKTKEEILSDVSPNDYLELDPEEFNEGTVEYAIKDCLGKGWGYDEIGKRVIKGAKNYISTVKPEDRKEKLFMEYMRIESELSSE